MIALERFEVAITACHAASGMPPSAQRLEAIEVAQELATNWLVEFEDEIRAALAPIPYTITEAGRKALEGRK